MESTSPGSSEARSKDQRPHRGLCVFSIGGTKHALHVDLVGEVVTVGTVVPVPRSHAAVTGLFNLRGSPIPLLDLGATLGLEIALSAPVVTAVVIRHEDLSIAFAVDSLDAVLAPDAGGTIAPEAAEHPAVDHFIAVEGSGAITVLESSYVIERILALRIV